MGCSTYYQAIPEESALFRELLSNRRLATVLDRFFISGDRPLDIDEAGSQEIDEALDDIRAHQPDEFRSRADVEAVLAELKAKIRRADVQHPGLIARTAFLEKCHDDIKERLIGYLDSTGRGDESELVHTMIFGKHHFCEGLQAECIPSLTVMEVAALLRTIPPDVLYRDHEDWSREDYEWWRELFLLAAERGEAILVY